MRALAALASLLLASLPMALAEPRPQRVVSLDVCADQFVLGLADPDQLRAVSPHAAKGYSYFRDRAAGLPAVRDGAEDILALRPDLVVRAYGGGPGAEAYLQRLGVPVVQLAFGEDFDTVRANITRVADRLGQGKRGRATVAEMDARLVRAGPSLAGQSAPGQAPAALYLSQAGVVAGQGGMIDAMLRAAGLSNHVRGEGWRTLDLEDFARRPPALLVAAFFDGRARFNDWSPSGHALVGQAMARIPTVRIDGAVTSCNGWWLADAVEAMAAARGPAASAAHVGGANP